MHLKAFHFDFAEKLTEGKCLCKEHTLPSRVKCAKPGRGVGMCGGVVGEFQKHTNESFTARWSG